ncbi:hypothetical protein B0H14DRAFT_3490236 [Mycena olivaceomarginata]|nr:hypothetical protein B0H14DRAFT_3490236 [Mycena olivaceomarginata]
MQNRVLRTRRPGVGDSEVDRMILEHDGAGEKRRILVLTDGKLTSAVRGWSLIPADTPFLLTSRSTVFVHAAQGVKVTSVVLDKGLLTGNQYFGRPEALRAYREQVNIETPEFTRVDTPFAARGRLTMTHAPVVVPCAHVAGVRSDPSRRGGRQPRVLGVPQRVVHSHQEATRVSVRGRGRTREEGQRCGVEGNPLGGVRRVFEGKRVEVRRDAGEEAEECKPPSSAV